MMDPEEIINHRKCLNASLAGIDAARTQSDKMFCARFNENGGKEACYTLFAILSHEDELRLHSAISPILWPEEDYISSPHRTIHTLKCWPEYFNAIATGQKTFDVRLNDRAYKKGDILVFRCWDPKTNKYSIPMSDLSREVSYILEGGQFGIELGYVVLGLKDIGQ